MSIVLDVAVIAVVVLFFFIGKHRGFVATLLQTVGFFLALYFAFALCNPVADYITNTFIRPSLVDATCKRIETSVFDTSKGETIVNDVWDAFPQFIRSAAEHNGITKEDIKNKINDTSYTTAKEKAETIVDDIEIPPIKKLVTVLSGILLFVIAALLVKLLTHLINAIFKLPGLKTLNNALGGVLGIAEGLLVATFLCVALSAVISLNNGEIFGISDSVINKTYIFRIMYGFSPFN